MASESSIRRRIFAYLEAQRLSVLSAAGVAVISDGAQITQPKKTIVTLQEAANTQLGCCTLHGEHTWLAAGVLCQVLQHEYWAAQLKGKRIIELGSGTGAVGLIAAAMGGPNARVVLTDCQPTIVAALEAQIAHNCLTESCTAIEYWWGLPPPNSEAFEVVLAAGCTYTVEATNSLCAALDAGLVDAGTLVLLALEERASTSACLDVLSTRGWSIETVHSWRGPPSAEPLAPHPFARVLKVSKDKSMCCE